MKLTIPGKALYRIAALAASCAKRPSPMGALECVRFVASEERLHAFGTNLVVGVQASEAAKVTETGSVCVDAKTITSIAKAMGPVEVTLSLKSGDRLDVRAPGGKYRLNGMPADDFPTVPGLRTRLYAHTDAAVLADALERVSYAAALSADRFAVNTVYFHSRGREVRLVSADGSRLATFEVELTEPIDSALVPIASVPSILNVLHSHRGEVGLGVADGYLAVGSEHALAAVRLSADEYPDYERIFPTGACVRAEVVRGDLMDALTCAAIVSNDKFRQVLLAVEEGQLTLSAESAEIGRASESISCETDAPLVYLVGVSGLYLLEALRSFCSEKIALEFYGPYSPIKVCEPVGGPGAAIIAPLRSDG